MPLAQVLDALVMLAQRLAEWLSHSDSPELAGGSVLELGSLGAGNGLAGLTCWKLGARRVCLTDLPERLPKLRRKVDAMVVNGDTRGITVLGMDWTLPSLPPSLAADRYDLILAPDCVFRPELYAPLLSTLGALCGKDRYQRVLLAVAASSEAPERRAESFLAAAHDAGWVSTPLPWREFAPPPPAGSLEALRRRQCQVHELRRGRTSAGGGRVMEPSRHSAS